MDLFMAKNAAIPLSGGATEHKSIQYIMQYSKDGKEEMKSQKSWSGFLILIHVKHNKVKMQRLLLEKFQRVLEASC